MKLISLTELIQRAISMYDMQYTKENKSIKGSVPDAYRKFFIRYLTNTKKNKKSLLEIAYKPNYNKDNKREKYYFSEKEANDILASVTIRRYCKKYSYDMNKVINFTEPGDIIKGVPLGTKYVFFNIKLANGEIKPYVLPVDDKDFNIVISNYKISLEFPKSNTKGG